MTGVDKTEWSNYQRLVLAELKRHSDGLVTIEKQLSKIEIEIATLKVKSGLIGVAGGMIPVLIALLLQLLNKK